MCEKRSDNGISRGFARGPFVAFYMGAMTTPNDSAIAAHLLATLFGLREQRSAATLETLAARVGVRRRDVRRVLSALHREGLVDVLRMRLTLRGLALGATFATSPLRAVRGRATRSAVAA